LQAARQLHSEVGGQLAIARQKREQRDELIRRVRADDERHWTYARLAAEVGCSQELIAYIITGGKRSG